LQQIDELEDSVQIKEQIAQLLIQQGRFSEAEKILQEMIKQYPDNNELQFKLALVYLQTEALLTS
jgi:predicted Zn-dependent protease